METKSRNATPRSLLAFVSPYPPIKFSYMKKVTDETSNATYYYLDPTMARTVAKTVRVSERCNVDIDVEGYPIGVELI